MKQWIRRGAALGLALALTVTAASASQAMGWDVHTGRAPLSQGPAWEERVLERYLFRPAHRVLCGVFPQRQRSAHGGLRLQGYRPGDLSGMAQTLESQGKRVVSGLNGDWYVLSTGAPTGLVVTDGIVRATGYYNDTWAIGFNADGTAFIARNGLSVSVSLRRAGRKAGRRHQ